MGDPIFDSYYASTVPSLAENAAQEASMQPAGAALLDAIGKPVILVAHSQGGAMAWVTADRKPDLVHSIVSIEPSGPPFQNAIFGSGPARPYGLTDIPITYSPPATDPDADFVKQTITSNSSAISDCVIQADDPPPDSSPTCLKFGLWSLQPKHHIMRHTTGALLDFSNKLEFQQSTCSYGRSASMVTDI